MGEIVDGVYERSNVVLVVFLLLHLLISATR